MVKATTSTTPVPSVWRRRKPRSMKASVTAREGGQMRSIGIHVASRVLDGTSTGVYQHTTRMASSVATGRPVSSAYGGDNPFAKVSPYALSTPSRAARLG